jgi:hypothetical protein
MPQGEGDSTSNHHGSAAKNRRQTCQSQRVGIVGMEHHGGLKLTNNDREDPRIESSLPSCRVDPNPVGREPACQLALGGGNYDLSHSPFAQLTSEKPDLPLTPTPLPSGSNVNDRWFHAPGSTSAGSAPRS